MCVRPPGVKARPLIAIRADCPTRRSVQRRPRMPMPAVHLAELRRKETTRPAATRSRQRARPTRVTRRRHGHAAARRHRQRRTSRTEQPRRSRHAVGHAGPCSPWAVPSGGLERLTPPPPRTPPNARRNASVVTAHSKNHSARGLPRLVCGGRSETARGLPAAGELSPSHAIAPGSAAAPPPEHAAPRRLPDRLRNGQHRRRPVPRLRAAAGSCSPSRCRPPRPRRSGLACNVAPALRPASPPTPRELTRPILPGGAAAAAAAPAAVRRSAFVSASLSRPGATASSAAPPPPPIAGAVSKAHSPRNRKGGGAPRDAHGLRPVLPAAAAVLPRCLQAPSSSPRRLLRCRHAAGLPADKDCPHPCGQIGKSRPGRDDRPRFARPVVFSPRGSLPRKGGPNLGSASQKSIRKRRLWPAAC